jgi:thiol-disulfide isomerase/thioredoxin
VSTPPSNRPRAVVRAPDFGSGRWLNTAGPLSLRKLRGKVVLLDFWTFACGNCLHVIDELRPLETRFADELVIIGVHSPKFAHERSDAAVQAAIERYDVGHPVFNDPELRLWQQYAVRAWPTLVLIDPKGYVVAQAAGEGQAANLSALIEDLILEAEADGTLRRGSNPHQPPVSSGGELRFPAKAIALDGSLFIADAGHHQLVQAQFDPSSERLTVLRRIGSGHRGAGSLDFAEPNGVTALPPELSARVGFDLVVADTANHRLSGVRSSDGTIQKIIDLAAALTASSTRTVTGPVPAVLSPWDVAWWPALGRVAIAAAGVHLLLSWDPLDEGPSAVAVLAGTTVEGLKDGPAADGWLAQPSGLAVQGDRLWFVDSESSALRHLTVAGQLQTLVGEGLFDFGHVDGPAKTARLQHPLGVAVLPDGSIAVADTYNGAVRRYDPVEQSVSTLASELDEPSGLVLVDGRLVVLESGAHRLTTLPNALAGAAGRAVAGQSLRSERPVTELAAGRVELLVAFDPPSRQKLDDRYGPATSLMVSATPPELLAAGAGEGLALSRVLELVGEPGLVGVLHVTAQAASCDDDELVANPACHLARQDWGVPVRLTARGASVLELPLLG